MTMSPNDFGASAGALWASGAMPASGAADFAQMQRPDANSPG